MTLEAWNGEWGEAYRKRQSNDLKPREEMWDDIFQWWQMEDLPDSILEVGANVGHNLDAFPYEAALYGLEPYKVAHRILDEKCVIVDGTATDIRMEDGHVDLAFTCGVLIHIPPDDLLKACSEIVRVSRRYVLAIEYFSDKPVEEEYRGLGGMMWKRDFGKFYLDNFDLKTVDHGFFWKESTGLDNLNWWLFEKN